METLETTRAPVAVSAGWWYRESGRSIGSALLVALVGASLIGGLTSLGQQYLPPWVNSLANSAGGWTMFCFLIVWLARARPLLAAGLGVLVFQLLVESYSVVTEWRGFDDGDPFSSIWTLVGLAAGPLVGTAAGLVRYAPPLWRALAVTPLAAVLLGEGTWALNTIVDTTSPVFWTLEIVLSVVFVALAVGRERLSARLVSLVVCVWLAGTIAYIGVCTIILN